MKGYFTRNWRFLSTAMLTLFLFSFQTDAQTNLGEITTGSTGCNLEISVCNGDTLLLNPTNTTNFTNFQWHYGAVGTTISGANAGQGVVSVSNDSLVATGMAAYGTPVTRTYILTGEYALPLGLGCAAINDTIIVTFNPTPVLSTVPDTICTAAGETSNLMSLVTDASATTGTTRFYSTLALALAGGAGDVTSPAAPTSTTKYYVRKETGNSCYDIDSLTVTVRCLALGNIVWYDTDNDGELESGESVIPGVTMNLYFDENGNGTLSGTELIPIATDDTDLSGQYLFENLKEGKYFVGVAAAEFSSGGTLQNLYSSGTSRAANGTISEATADAVDADDSDLDDNGTLQTSGDLAGVVLTSPIMLMYNLEPESESPDNSSNAIDTDDNLTADFGFYGMSIGSLVFMDNNNNGTYLAADDMPAAGVTVKLYSGDGSLLIATTTTGTDGRYLFTNLPEGNYIVGVVTPAGKFSSDDIASSSTPNSNDNDDNGTTTIGAETWSNIVTLDPESPIINETDQTQTTAAGMGSPAAFDNIRTPDGNSNLHVDFGFKPACPTIENPSADQVICAGDQNSEGTNLTVEASITDSIRWVRFDEVQTGNAMYSGGTNLDTVQGTGASAPFTATLAFEAADFPNASNSTPDTFYVYAVLYPTPADPTCRPFQQIRVIVNPIPTAAPATLTECETATGDGTYNFTLSNATATVLGAQTGMTTTYHNSQADADNDANPITTKTATNGTVVYARVETSAGCFATSQVILNVNLRPQFTLSLPPVCPGNSPEIQIALGAGADANPQVSVNSGSNFAFNNLTSGILTTANGVLTNDSNSVVLTNANTCTNSQTIVTPDVQAKVCLPVKVTKLN